MGTIILATGSLSTPKTTKRVIVITGCQNGTPFPGSDCKFTPSLTRNATAFSMLLFRADTVEGLRSMNGISALARKTEI